MTNDLETRMASMETQLVETNKTNKKMQHEIDRLRAYVEIQNLMSRYVYWHTSNHSEKKATLLATKAEGARVEYNNSGVFEGIAGLHKFVVGMHPKAGSAHAGELIVHPVSTPLIEVAGDGKTARGLWISDGFETVPKTYSGGGPTVFGVWEAYAADFIKEDGGWKFWRIHLQRVITHPYGKSWVEIDVPEYYTKDYGMGPWRFPPEMQPDRPTTTFKLYSLNDTNSWTDGTLVAPEPYETYEEWMACVKKGD
jgi:hypothetical protein